MDQREDQRRTIEETRERIGQVAGELASRANAPYVKARIKEVAEKEGEVLKAAAMKQGEILKDAAMKKAADVAEEVKEAAMRKVVIVKARVLGSPTTYSLLGALGGWLVGSLIGKRLNPSLTVGVSADPRVSPFQESAADPYAPAMGVGERASEAISDAKHKASDAVTAVKDKIGDTVSHVRERIPSAHDMSEKTDAFIHTAANTRPLLFALVPIFLGAIAALLLPVSAQERRALSAAKQKVNEQLSALGEKVEDRIAAGPDPINAEQAPTNAEPGPVPDAPPKTEVHIH